MPKVPLLRRRNRLGPYEDINKALEKPFWQDTYYGAQMTSPLLHVARMSKEMPYQAHFSPYIALDWSHGYPYLYVAYLSAQRAVRHRASAVVIELDFLKLSSTSLGFFAFQQLPFRRLQGLWE